ncbi:SGNH/GDSL hydrolase family protein [uncultured Roseobacter sp.]|uniref:SGNH/GDSL hydrolase family protein n=1 Tax=uncultured Roseobacter sp. TaxID=114847 RepID=UPI00263130EB|nr:SGNH/GDSL hydrolase family protein [uncultured Roseobacter sp.]
MIRTLVIAIGLSTASVASADPGLEAFTSYYAFGDSLSQDDKLPQLTPPSLDGRFSSGRVWTEYLADVFNDAGKDTRNFALGGATAGAENTTPYEGFFPAPRTPAQDAQLAQLRAISTFDGQVQVAQATVPDPGDNPLVSVLFGANDIFQKLPNVVAEALNTSDPLEIPGRVAAGIGALASETVGSIVSGINKLHAGNDAFDDFLVVNLADISKTPAFGAWGIGAAQAELDALITAGAPLDDIRAAALQLEFLSADPSFAKLASLAFNETLAAALAGVAPGIETLDEDIQISVFDQAAFLEDFIATSALNGINVSEPCTPSFTANAGISCVYVTDDAGNIIGLDLPQAENFFFGDSVHPTGFVQEEFGRRVIASLEGQMPAPVPLPAGLPLLVAGLGAFGLIARRKTKRAA